MRGMGEEEHPPSDIPASYGALHYPMN